LPVPEKMKRTTNILIFYLYNYLYNWTKGE
jgi:hypothetical protein